MGSPVTKKSFFNMLSFLLIITLSNNIEQIQGFSTEVPSNLSESNSTEVGLNRTARRSVVSGGLFSIVTFENVPCTGSDGDIGTCYSGKECTNLGGKSQGICANNFGVCCVVFVTCGGTVTANNTYFVNPDYPNPSVGPLTCTITVNRLANAEYLYLDFIQFTSQGPSGGCTNDTFSVTTSSGASSSNPPLCGDLTGSDEYISWSSIGGRSFSNGFFRTARQTLPSTATLSFTLREGSEPRRWKIRIVQFKATDACAPPSGCTQYIRNTTGTVQSYNYKNGEGEIISTNGCINQCFALPTGYCSVLLSSTCASDSTCGFMLPGTSPSTCGSDFLQINGVNYCGDTFGTNGMVTATRVGSMNYVPIRFCTGSSNPTMEPGYKLGYTLQAC